MDANTRIRLVIGELHCQMAVMDATIEAQAVHIKELEALVPKPEPAPPAEPAPATDAA